MKIPLEYNIVGDGREFLNYWDLSYGNDVVAEIKKGGKLFDGDKEITLDEFLDAVKERLMDCEV
jgi:hypothetical protein